MLNKNEGVKDVLLFNLRMTYCPYTEGFFLIPLPKVFIIPIISLLLQKFHVPKPRMGEGRELNILWKDVY